MKNTTKNTIETLDKVQAAISALDPRGDNESVNDAMAIVWRAICDVREGVKFTAAELATRAANDRKEEVI